MARKPRRKAPAKRTTRAPRRQTKIVNIAGRRTPAATVIALPATPRKRRSGVGKTANINNVKTIATIAIGVAGGAAVSKFVIQPVTGKLAERFPFIAPWLPAFEILAGGFIAMRSKKPMIKAGGLGILATGVSRGVDQLGLYKQLGIGASDYQTIRVPINGQLDSMIAGVLKNPRREVYTSKIAGQALERTNAIADVALHRTSVVANTDNVLDWPAAKGMW